MSEISKVAVIGAGTMGSGIASHLANAGIDVVLLDVPGQPPHGRNAIAENAITRLLQGTPPQFTHPDNATLITPGNMEDDLHLLADCDWVAEAIVERLDIKHALYRRLEEVCRPDALISSNTSTIPLAMLTEGMPAERRRSFCITHFFNPVRYMRLLEIVAGDHCAPSVIDLLANFCDQALGKGVVHCADRPGFLGNRVGVYALQVALIEAVERDIGVEAADALMGRPMGIPKTGAFGLYDLIGLDLMQDVAQSLRTALPPEDPFQEVAAGIPAVSTLVEKGYTGRKGLGGFYRDVVTGDESVREVLDLTTGEFNPTTRPVIAAAQSGESRGLRAMVEHDDRFGSFAWRVLARTLSYAASLIPEVTHSPDAIDEAMRLGFNWNKGPFEMIDELGVRWFRERLRADNLPVPEFLEQAGDGPLYKTRAHTSLELRPDGTHQPIARPSGVLRLNEFTATRERVAGNEAASIWDLDDGVLCIEFHSKANALHPRSMEVVADAAERSKASNCKALLVHTAAPHFSVGFNIDFVLHAIEDGDWAGIDHALNDFQQSCMALKYAPVPVVAAPGGMALGGGFEVVVQSDAVFAHVNTVMGLVESMVGLVPGGGGCKEMLHRWTTASNGDAQAGALRTFESIGMAKTGASPRECQPLQMFLPRDRSTMSRDRLLPQAKAFALELAPGYCPPQAPLFAAPGAKGRDLMHTMLDGLVAKGIALPHDEVVSKGLARVLAGGDAVTGDMLSEQDLLDLEREVFVSLSQTEGTRNRISHMLRTGRPLRN